VTTKSQAAELRRLVNGYQLSQALSVAATLGLADLLADGARVSDELAEATGSHPDALYRLLRALAGAGVLHEGDNRRFSLTELGEPLRRDAPESVHGWAAFVGRPYYRAAWSELLHAVHTGENAFRHVHGVDPWTYRAERPDESALFDRAMESSTRGSIAAVLQAYDFGRFETVVDVGGGNGTLLAALLEAYPAMRGVVFDQPHVVDAAAALLRGRGLSDRCSIEGGSFFDGVPSGGDAYVLKHIVHDWEDDDAVAILRTVREARRRGRRCSCWSATSAPRTRRRSRSSATSTCSSCPAAASAPSRSTPQCSRQPGSGTSARSEAPPASPSTRRP
jgi:hypothetical protein